MFVLVNHIPLHSKSNLFMNHAVKIQDFIESLTENNEMIVQDGGMTPTMFFLTYQDNDYKIGCFDVPSMLIDNEKGKDILAEVILPKIKETIKENGQELVCVAFVSEVWKYAMKKDYEYNENHNYKENYEEKTEQVMWAFHLENKVVHYYCEMIRENGKLVALGEREIMEVPYDEDNKGRFAKLF